MIHTEHIRRLPSSPKRKKMSAILDAASDMDSRVKAFAENGLVEVVQNGDELPATWHCGEYALKGVLQLDWLSDSYKGLPNQNLYSPDGGLHFLSSRGFNSVDAEDTDEGLLVAYTTGQYLTRVHHYGVAQSRDLIRSKFASGPVLDHELAVIPPRWGTHYVCLQPPSA